MTKSRIHIGCRGWKTMMNKLVQVGYRWVYPAMLFFWRLSKVPSHGVQVALWVKGRVLLIRNSYRDCYGFPGGGVQGGERAIDAARRELLEETGVALSADRLTPVEDMIHFWNGVRIRDEVFECSLPVEPQLNLDNREVVEAEFYHPAEALALPLTRPVGIYLRKTVGKQGKRI